MRRITLWLASTVTIVVLMFGYHTSTNSTATAPTSTSSSQAGGSSTASSGSGSGSPGSADPLTPTPSSSPNGSASSSSSGSQTYTGSAAQTRWGPVQVEITVEDGKVTAVDVVEYPTQNRSQQISAQALPILVQETLDAQTADIDMVSGATGTSEGYAQSLQAALDQAGI